MFEIVKQLPDMLIVRATGTCDAEMAKRCIQEIVPAGKSLLYGLWPDGRRPFGGLRENEATNLISRVSQALEELGANEAVLYEEHDVNYHALRNGRNDYLHISWYVCKREEGGGWGKKRALIHAYSHIYKGDLLVLCLS